MHRPGLEIERVLPSQRERLLFDDILFLPAARAEFDRLVAIIKKIDAEVLLFEDLATDGVMFNDEKMNTGFKDSEDSPRSKAQLMDMITGNGTDPLPNLMFHRDLGISVGSTFCFTAMSEQARVKESELLRWLVLHHPVFDSTEVIYDAQAFGDLQRGQTGRNGLEGGDVLCLRPDLLMVGDSIRSSRAQIDAFAKAVLEDRSSQIESVVVVKMPRARSYMHLDTIFTMISPSEALVHKPLILDEGSDRCSATTLSLSSSNELTESTAVPVLKALRSLGLDLDYIICGGDNLNAQHREQWTDGANAFCLAPGIIVLYRRNQETAKSLEAAGYEILIDDDFLGLSAEEIESAIAARKKIVVLFSGNELSRARGGPRCLTLPLKRDS